MKAKIRITREVDVRYMQVDAGVRYWEDGEVNGTQDSDSSPSMPFAMKVREYGSHEIFSYRWRPLIDVEGGRIVNWPKGTTANVHYKVCDDGVDTLLDADKKEIVSVNSYVPDCIGQFGDYIIMSIDGNGYIDDFRFSAEDVDEIIRSDFNNGGD